MQSDNRPDPARSREALEAQLRALPQPTVPAHLEALLLASVPVARPILPRRRTVRAAVLGVASAACLMAMLAWWAYLGKDHPTIPVPGGLARRDAHRRAFESPGMAAWREDPRSLEEEKLPAYSWPLGEIAIPRASISISADLLD